MQNVLIITYHWPPAGGPGVQRVLKFAKYLPAFGWTPLILTVSQGEYPARDESLLKEIPDEAIVFKTGALEPFSVYKRLTGLRDDEHIPTAVLAEKNLNWKKRAAHWVRLNLFIPDAKIGWRPFAVRTGKSIINKYKPAVIFSSSPPPVVHLIAKKLKKSSGLKWVADFRDPWTDIHYYDDQTRLKAAAKLDTRMEASVLNEADRITCISRLDIELDFSRKTAAGKCLTIPNGYDEEDFSSLKMQAQPKKMFNLVHLGAIGRERIPHFLFKSIRRLADEKIIHPGNFQLTLVGKIVPELAETGRNFHIEAFINTVSYLPHRESLEQAASASALLLLITQSKMNRRILPGKTFEYMRLGKPILALGPEDGEVARLLNETGSGRVIGYQEEAEIYRQLKNLIASSGTEIGKIISDRDRIEKFSRRHLTGDLAAVFDSICLSPVKGGMKGG